MAQTKRKRQTKHRGNAVGMVEVRGRTGRKPTAAEKKKGTLSKSEEARARREARYDTPPTWRGVLARSAFAAFAFVFLLLIITKQNPGVALVIGVVMFGVYWPMSYYMELFVYNRRQRKKALGK